MLMEKNPKLGRTVIIIVVVIFLASCLVIFGSWECGLWDKFLAYYDRMSDREWMRETVKSAGWAAALHTHSRAPNARTVKPAMYRFWLDCMFISTPGAAWPRLGVVKK